MDTHHLTFSDKSYVKLAADSLPDAGDEHALWRDFKKGDVASYAVMYKKYFFVLYQYGKKICNDHELVKDSIQDLFIKLWNNRENLKETSSIKYYLFTSLKRKLIDTLSGPHARLTSDQAFIESDIFIAEDMEEDDIHAKKEEVLRALTRLSDHQQKLLHLKFYKNRTNQEIAEEMGITIQSVYNAVFKTLKSLRNQLSILIAAILVYL